MPDQRKDGKVRHTSIDFTPYVYRWLARRRAGGRRVHRTGGAKSRERDDSQVFRGGRGEGLDRRGNGVNHTRVKGVGAPPRFHKRRCPQEIESEPMKSVAPCAPSVNVARCQRPGCGGWLYGDTDRTDAHHQPENFVCAWCARPTPNPKYIPNPRWRAPVFRRQGRWRRKEETK